MTSSRRRVGAVDTLWLEMDRPDNLMVIDAVMWFDEPVDWDRLSVVVERRLVARYPVFRQRPVHAASRLGLPHWEDDPEFSLDRHLYRATLEPPGDQASLQRYVEDQVPRPLDRRRPLWQLHMVDGFRGGSAVLARFHHSLADGIALAEILLSLTDDAPDADLLDLPWADDGSRRSARPRPVGRRTAPLVRQVAHVVDKLVVRSLPRTPISRQLVGPRKRTVWTDALPLDDVKDAAHRAGVTVNDMLLSALAGAVGTYLTGRGAEPADLTTMVPVNLRAPGEPLPRELGNRFALVLVPLPAGETDAWRRLAETRRRMDAIKGSPEALITFALMTVIGRLPPLVSRPLVGFFSGKAIGVTTNVIGPGTPRFVGGTRITGILGWVPGSGRQSLGVCIFTYDGTVRVGFKADASLVPDAERLVAGFETELSRITRPQGPAEARSLGAGGPGGRGR